MRRRRPALQGEVGEAGEGQASTGGAEVILLALALATSPQQWTPNTAWHLFGVGNTSCGQWLVQKDDPAYRLSQVAWAGGFVSGINLAGGGKITDTDPESLVAYIDQQCTQEPLEKVAGITFKFFYRLRNRQKVGR